MIKFNFFDQRKEEKKMKTDGLMKVALKASANKGWDTAKGITSTMMSRIRFMNNILVTFITFFYKIKSTQS